MKLGLITVCAVLASAWMTLSLTLPASDAHINEQFAREGQTIATAMALTLEQETSTPVDHVQLRELLNTYQPLSSALSYVILRDNQQQVLAHSLNPDINLDPASNSTDSALASWDAMNITAPVKRLDATLHLGIERTPLNTALFAFRQHALFAHGVGTCMGIALGLFILFVLVIPPLRALATAAELVATGDLTPRHLDHHRRDELGLIAEGFNTMLNQLRHRGTRPSWYKEELQHRIQHSTQSLRETNTRLLHDKSAAETKAATKSRLLANISHELRTPLNGIIGMTRLLLRSQLSPQQTHYAGTVKTSAEGLLKVINDVLDFSKLNAGKLRPQWLHFRPRPLIAQLIELLQTQAGPRGLTLRATVDEEVPELIKGDPHRLRQILFNLAGNGIKFTTKGEVALHVALIEQREDNITLHFEVSDTGEGIAPEHQERIFEAFAQESQHSAPSVEGTGLGLAISRNLVELMGGTLQVTSARGVGSTFSFSACFKAATDDASEDTDPFLAPAPRTTIGAAPAVLLVEDNLVNQEVSMGILQDLGYRPELAENGNEAVEKLSGGDHDFSAVLMDCQMPVLDGYQATELIRQRERGAARIPIIAMTSRAMSGDRDKALAAGMDDYITKPASPERLNSILAKWIKAPPKSS